MTLSRIVAVDVISATGIKEKYNTFNPKADRSFSKGLRLIDGESVYERIGDDLYVKDFDKNKTDYSINDVVWKNNRLEYIKDINTDEEVALQPEEYENIDTDLNSDNWRYRYLKLGTLGPNPFSNSEKEVIKLAEAGEYKYIYWLKKDSNNNVTFTLKKIYTGSITWHTDYDPSNCKTDCLVETKDHSLYAYLEVQKDLSGRCITGTTTIRDKAILSNYEYLTEYCDLIKAQNKITEDNNNNYYEYISYDNKDDYYVNDITVYYSSSLNKTEEKANVADEDGYVWIPNCIIIRGNDVYIRTSVDAEQQTKIPTEITTEPLYHINQISWGWTYVEPTQKIAPFDTKAYTKLKQINSVTYTLRANSEFDVLATAKLYCSKIKIKIEQDVYEFTPKCEVIKDDKRYSKELTAIYYLNKLYPANTNITVTFKPLHGKLVVGLALLGNKIPLGFTLTQFSNNPKDFSFYEQDEFGNVNYIERAKLNRVDYSAEIDTIDLDFTSMILKQQAGKITIVDGSDNIENKDIDSLNYFETATMIGRFRDPRLSTISLEDGAIAKIAKYNFTAEEIV